MDRIKTFSNRDLSKSNMSKIFDKNKIMFYADIPNVDYVPQKMLNNCFYLVLILG